MSAQYVQIMLFYAVLSYLVLPAVFYYFATSNKLVVAGNGFALGSVISIVLWYVYGAKMVGQ